MGEYKFDINGMGPGARQEANEAARTTLHMKDGAGMDLASDMLRARDMITALLQNFDNDQALNLGELQSGRDAKQHYQRQRKNALAGLVKIRDHYQAHADHFIAAEMLIRNTEERNAGRINPYKDGTATVKY